MDFHVRKADFIRPKSSLDFDPLHQPQTEINFGKVQTLAANSKRLLPFGCGDWIVNHSREITDFNKELKTSHQTKHPTHHTLINLP